MGRRIASESKQTVRGGPKPAKVGLHRRLATIVRPRLMIVYHLSALVSVLSGTDVFGAIDIVFIRKTQYCKCAVLDRIDNLIIHTCQVSNPTTICSGFIRSGFSDARTWFLYLRSRYIYAIANVLLPYRDRTVC
jgi:hypothetical protein